MTKKKSSTKRTRKPRYLDNMVSFYIGGAPYLARVRPAKTHERFTRELKHCQMGEEGECASCANAQAAMDAKIAPFMVFIDSRAVAIDKWVKGTVAGGKAKAYFGDGRIWEHSQGGFQKKYDMDKEALLRCGDAVGQVVLRPYRTNKPGSGPNKVGKTTTNPKGVRPLRESPRSRKGSLRRAQRAGIFPSGVTKG